MMSSNIKTLPKIRLGIIARPQTLNGTRKNKECYTSSKYQKSKSHELNSFPTKVDKSWSFF